MGPKIELMLDPRSAHHGELQEQLEENLRGFESITYKRVTQPAPPGTLIGGEQIVGFVVEHYDQLIPLVASLVQIATAILGMRKREKGEPTPVIVVVNGRRLSLPASDETRRRFVKQLEGIPSTRKQPRGRKRDKDVRRKRH